MHKSNVNTSAASTATLQAALGADQLAQVVEAVAARLEPRFQAAMTALEEGLVGQVRELAGAGAPEAPETLASETSAPEAPKAEKPSLWNRFLDMWRKPHQARQVAAQLMVAEETKPLHEPHWYYKPVVCAAIGAPRTWREGATSLAINLGLTGGTVWYFGLGWLGALGVGLAMPALAVVGWSLRGWYYRAKARKALGLA